MLRRIPWLVGALVLGVGGEAQAKGEGGGISGFCFGQNALAANTVRFPEAQPEMIVVSTNFGLLVSRDAGATYGWVCPQVYGAQIAGNFTLFSLPGVAALPSGTIIVLSGGLGYWISSEEACHYESAPDPDLRSATVVSVASRAAAPGVVYAALSWPGRTPFGVWMSLDDAGEFDATELQSDERLRFGSVHLTPGGERVYVTTRTADGLVGLWHSDDGATGWTPGLAEATAVNSTIVASRAGNPDEVYLEATESISGACEFDVSVQRSLDAGDTFEPIAERNEILVGVVVDDEGAVWIGWKDTGVEVWRDGVVEPVEGSPAPIGCLLQAPGGGLAVCPLGDPSALVSVRDPDTGTFTPLLTLDRITGPLDCPADTPVGRECGDRWNELTSFWGIGDGDPDRDGGPSGPDGGGGLDGGGGGDGDGSIGGDDTGGGGDGCSCTVAGAPARAAHGTDAGWGAALLLALLVSPRRRRRLLGAVVAAAGALSGCGGDVDPWSRPIEWGLGEDEYWPDLRDAPGVGDGRIIVTNNLDDTVRDRKSVV